MEYAFIGMMIPENDYDEVLKNSKDSMQDAANALQWHMYNGLCQNLEEEIRIISAIPIHSWPKYYKKIRIKKKYFETQYNTGNISVGFWNFKGIRIKSRMKGIYDSLLEWLDTTSEGKIVFLYTLSGAFLEAIYRVKIKYPTLKVCAIVADLPNMTNLSSKQSLLNKIFNKFHTNNYWKYRSCIDYYVLLTKHMASYLDIDKPYCVVEGIATSSDEFGEEREDNSEEKIVLYTGTLHKKFGVMNLIKAFHQIPYKNYKLILCGVGDCEEEIQESVRQDSRIKFLGQRPRQDILRFQRNATVVVNPRQNIEEFCKYSFPSKNLEYMSSGTPLIAYKLDGIPDEYDEYIYYVEGNSVDALRGKIVEVCELPMYELHSKGERARQYVEEYKNETVQTKKVVDLIMHQR